MMLGYQASYSETSCDFFFLIPCYQLIENYMQKLFFVGTKAAMFNECKPKNIKIVGIIGNLSRK